MKALGVGLLLGFCFACAPTPNRDLTELILRDSVYFVPETMEPYTGDVFRGFPDEADKLQLEGHLTEGEWDGELVVYHANGRVRYMGSFSRGERCGAWTENADPDPPGSVFEQLKQEVEAMGLYPPCAEG
jgi:hypothetical protein